VSHGMVVNVLQREAAAGGDYRRWYL